jgi:DMSO/TMAO reductase YedYZ molybdopterin-dependent catalytic subunit
MNERYMTMKAQIHQHIEKRFDERKFAGRVVEAYEAVGRDIVQIFWIRMIGLSIPLFILVLLLITGCQTTQASEASSPTSEATAEASAATPSTGATSAPCTLEPIVVPTLPDEIPGYTQKDPATGLHVTGTAQEIDLESYRLEVTGKVDHPLSLSYDDLRCMPKIESRPTLICPGFFRDIATWAGVPLKHVLELAGVQEGASDVRLRSADGYSSTVSLSVALAEDNYLAYELEGDPVPILHGFPIRAIFPELGGNKWAKWLVKIEVY